MIDFITQILIKQSMFIRWKNESSFFIMNDGWMSSVVLFNGVSHSHNNVWCVQAISGTPLVKFGSLATILIPYIQMLLGQSTTHAQFTIFLLCIQYSTALKACESVWIINLHFIFKAWYSFIDMVTLSLEHKFYWTNLF